MSIISWPLEDWFDNVALGALSSKETLRTTFDKAISVIRRATPGDFVECGVYGGAQCAVMARAIMSECGYFDSRLGRWEWNPNDDPKRRVHLFDTFEGIPQAGEHDAEFIAAGHEAGLSACSLEAVQSHMREWGIPDELLVYHKGLFADTLHELYAEQQMKGALGQPQGIAILRLDGDLYQSTKDCLPLYDLIVPGGWLIIDDFGLSGARKAFMELVESRGMYTPAYFQKQP